MVNFAKLKEGDVVKKKGSGILYTVRESINGGYLVLRSEVGVNYSFDTFSQEDFEVVSCVPRVDLEDTEARMLTLAKTLDKLSTVYENRPTVELEFAMDNIEALINDMAKALAEVYE